MKFGDNLRNLRISRGLTQTQLAEALHSSQSSITSWETGSREPDFKSVARIAEFFGVSMSTLIPTNDVIDRAAAVHITDSLQQNPKLRMLFDRAKFLTDSDMDAVLAVVTAITKERGNDE